MVCKCWKRHWALQTPADVCASHRARCHRTVLLIWTLLYGGCLHLSAAHGSCQGSALSSGSAFIPYTPPPPPLHTVAGVSWSTDLGATPKLSDPLPSSCLLVHGLSSQGNDPNAGRQAGTVDRWQLFKVDGLTRGSSNTNPVMRQAEIGTRLAGNLTESRVQGNKREGRRNRAHEKTDSNIVRQVGNNKHRDTNTTMWPRTSEPDSAYCIYTSRWWRGTASGDGSEVVWGHLEAGWQNNR